jgi:antitoxin component of RelBE/YafQ-DinJ toxin-antitoxin module
MSKHAESTITFNTAADVKDRLQEMAKKNGLTISDLMRMSAMQVLNKGITIEPTLEPSDYLINAIRESEKDLAEGNTTSVKSADELTDHFQKLKR